MRNDWKAGLLLGRDRAPRGQLANAITALREAPEWNGVIAYDDFARQVVLRAPPPWEPREKSWALRAWTSHDDLLAAEWMQREDIAVTVKVTEQAIEAVARDASFHPVRERLDDLAHDGVRRLDTWLSEYLGADDTAYYREVGRIIMIGAVARIYDPGCKVDNVPIFEGPQGAKKSTAVRTLFDPWFTDDLADLGSKDAAMQTRGVWGVEISELDAMSRGEVSKIKAFISRTNDRFRPPYGNRIIESPRSCVFWGTTNSDGYLKDETGGRRFLPVRIGMVDVEGLKANRDQLWAEAVAAYRAGCSWWLISRRARDEAAEHQDSRYHADPWDEAIESFIANRSSVTVTEILRGALDLDIGRWGQGEQNRVARSLRHLRWERRQVRTGDGREWRYVRPVTGGDESEHEGNVTTLRVVTAK